MKHSRRTGLGHAFGSVVRIFARGAARGIGIAGTVNTVAPGLFSTLAGYLAATLKGTSALAVLGKFGLFTAGVLVPASISGIGILALGAVLGVVIQSVCSLAFFLFIARNKHPETDAG